MGYRLYMHKKGTEDLEWCGGKVYGYKGVEYKGAAYLYYVNEDFQEFVDFYWGSIENVEEKLRYFFECIPSFEIEITGEQYLIFLKLYREDAKYVFKYFDKIDLDAIYVLEWW